MLNPTANPERPGAGHRAGGAAVRDARRRKRADTLGFTRASYGRGRAIRARPDRRGRRARSALPVTDDAAGNMYITARRAASRKRARSSIGSHLDSVPQGGNFDGAAGVLAGMAVICRLAARRASAGRRCGGDGDPRRGKQLVSLFIYRLEGGARAAAGLRARYSARRYRPHARRSTWSELGFNPDAVRAGVAQMQAGGHPRLCRAAYRARTDAGRQEHAGSLW